MNVTGAPSTTIATKVTIRNATVATVVVVECPPGSWGANGEYIKCSKGTYRPGETDEDGCLDCPAGKYQPELGGSECTVCGAGNYSANTLSCEPCQVGEFCMAGTPVGERCPLEHSTTKGRGARSQDDCVCQVGYYMDEDGCVLCPSMGTALSLIHI